MQWKKWQCWAAPALLVVLTAAAYHNSFGGPFVFDDEAIPANPHIRKLWPVWEAARAPQDSTLARRPVTTLSFAVNYAFSELEVAGYHAVNLAVHLAAGLALLGVMRRTLAGFGRPTLASVPPAAAEWLAVVVAGIWMLHPLQTDTVTYLVQRTEGLMGMFYLLTLYCSIRGFGAGQRAGRWWYAAAVTCCGLGMGSKEVMISAPLFVLLYDRTLVSGGFGAALKRRPGLYAGLAATWVLLAAFVMSSPHASNSNFRLPDLTPWDYLKTQAGVLVHYLRLSLWPSPLVLDYSDWPIARSLGEVPVVALVLIPAMLAATVWLVVRRSPAALPAALFFMVLAPTSSILPMRGEVVAERRMYLPLAGVLSLSVIGAYVLARRAAERRASAAASPDPASPDASPAVSSPMPAALWWGGGGLVAAVAVACLVGTARRNEAFRTDLSIWTDTVDKRPQNARAWNNLGAAYCRREQWEEERACYVISVKLGSYSGLANLGLFLCRQGEYAEAVPPLVESIRFRSHMPWRVYHQLGVALMHLGRTEEAAPQLAQAARMAPDDAAARASYGFALIVLGRTGEGIGELREALRLSPSGVQETSQLAWVLATRSDPRHRNPAEAVRLAEAARDLSGGANPAVLDTLAAAYADAGRAEDAVRVGLQAEELATKAGHAAMARDFRRRVEEFYRAGRPYREDAAVAPAPTRTQGEASIREP